MFRALARAENSAAVGVAAPVQTCEDNNYQLQTKFRKAVRTVSDTLLRGSSRRGEVSITLACTDK